MRAIKKVLSHFMFGNRKKPKPQEMEGLCVGENTIVNCKIDIRKNGGEVVIGNGCLIDGMLVTETSQSKITIGNNVFVGGGCLVDCACKITIEDDVLISYQCILQDSDNHNPRYSLRKNDNKDWKERRYHNWDITPKGEILIKNGAWLGARVIILKGNVIGVGSIVGAGSVVTRDVPDWTVVAGNPATIIREIPINER